MQESFKEDGGHALRSAGYVCHVERPSQKISGHQGALATSNIASAFAAAPETNSSTRNACVSRVQVKPPSAGFVRATAGRLRWAQQAQTQAAIGPRGRTTRPTRRSAFVCKPGG